MKTFDCLNRSLNIHSHTLLEASAGTGKTFSIENLFVRLLIEEPVRVAQEILVVTFTKAATKELRWRIRHKIADSLKIIKEDDRQNAPDYLLALLEKGQVEIKQAKRRLEAALASFDLSKILTIHSFCERELRDHQFVLDTESHSLTELLTPSETLRVVRDFFRTKLTKDSYSPEQIRRVVKGGFSKLESDLQNILMKALPIEKRASYSEMLLEFQAAMKDLSQKYSALNLLDDYETLSPYYKKHEDADIETFCRMLDKEKVGGKDFDVLIRDGLAYAKRFEPGNRKRNKKIPEKIELTCPGFLEEIREKLQPLVEEARSREVIFCRMARDCQQMLHQYLGNQEKYRYDDLLALMMKRCRGFDFAEKVREQYGAVIIDEFQDTDPLQWQIFQTLFLHDPKRRSVVYLVGDPKQSIYAFRQADIYTYRAAAKELGDGHIGTLDVNWRSQPSMIQALNALFSQENAPGFISLPKENASIDYRPVSPSPFAEELKFSDQFGAVHFLVAEGKKGNSNWPTAAMQEERFFPALTNEIIRLKESDGIDFSEWAILVKDRHQAKKFASFCEKIGIPVRLQRQNNLIESDAYVAWKDLLAALIDPKDISRLKVVLAGPLVGWDHRKIRELESEENLTAVCEEMARLRQMKFASLYDGFLRGRFLVKERLVLSSLDFFHEFQQIAELLIDYQYRTNSSLMQCLDYLTDFEGLQNNDDEALKSRQNSDGSAVQILTMHYSKGLEFGIVAALGLMCRTKFKDKFITVEKDAERMLAPAIENEEMKNYIDEFDAEKMRQLYVAMTRAKYRVYVPMAVEEEGKEVPAGQASPLELFLDKFRSGPLTDWIDRKGKESGITYEMLSSLVEAQTFAKEKNEIEVACPKPLRFTFSNEIIRSFSSLAKARPSAELAAPHDFLNEKKNFHTLPAGREVGTLLHRILENIYFEHVSSAAASVYTKGTLFEDWNDVIAGLIGKVVKTPLNIGPKTLILRDIPSDKILRECEFLYPSSCMFLKGVIDFAFEFQGRYYLLDWKSNWLGPSCDDYNKDNLEKAMDEHDYFRQEEIYREAFKRYTSLFESRPFGGTVYLFLRGIENPETNGVYFRP